MSLQHVEAGKLGGRPLAYPGHDEFQAAVEAYFVDCEARGTPYTMAGLAYALDIDRKTLLAYQHRDERFLHTVKRARRRIEKQLEEQLLTREKQVAGHIFNLKNNFDWRDVQEIEHTHTITRFGVAPAPTLSITAEVVGESQMLSEVAADSRLFQPQGEAISTLVTGESS